MIGSRGSDGGQDVCDGGTIGWLRAAVREHDPVGTIEHEVSAQLADIGPGKPKSSAANQPLNVGREAVPVPQLRRCCLLQPEGRVGLPRWVEHKWKRHTFSVREERGAVGRFERDHDDMRPERGDLGLALAQLREVLSARNSTEPPEKYQEYRSPGQLTQSNLPPMLIDEGHVGSKVT
jgi:hypothetical protein